MKLVLMQGLPASGKSTWVREQIKTPGVVRVEGDLIRRMLHGEQFLEEHEETVDHLAIECIISLLSRRAHNNINTIIYDECATEGDLGYFKLVAATWDAEFEVKSFLDVPLEECIRRDSLRSDEKRLGKDVVLKVAKKYGIQESRENAN